VRSRVVIPLLALLVAGFAAPALAQYTEEEETEDHRLQDEQYYKRYAEQEEKQAADEPQDEAALAQAFLDKADALIRDKNYRSFENDRYRVQADDPRLDVKAVVALLDGFRSFFDEFWSARTEPRPYEERSRVFLFYSYHKYNQLLSGDWQRQMVRPKGHYGSMFDAVVIHTDSDRPSGLPNTLVHEATHQLVDQRLYLEGGRPSLWIAEGLATYFENTFMDASGTFEAGVIGGKQISVLRGGRDKAVSNARIRTKKVRDALREAATDESALTFRVVAADDPNEFYGEGAFVRYDVSWLMIHYLLHGDDGAHADAFARYIGIDARGQGGPDLLFAEIGMTPEELDAALQDHLKTLKIR